MPQDQSFNQNDSSSSPNPADPVNPPSTTPAPPPEVSNPLPPPASPPTPPFPISVANESPESPESPPPSGPTEPPPPEPEQPAKIVEPLAKRLVPFGIGLAVIIVLFLLITKVILPLVKKPQTPDVVTLNYWGLWEPENIISALISDYQQLHPEVVIQYTNQSPKDYRERLQSALARGEGPDIFRFHNTWLPMLKSDLAPVPDSVYSQSEFNLTFYPVMVSDLTLNNKIYGIPLGFDALALYVNQQIFDSVPDLQIPQTWDSLRRTAFNLTQRDDRGNLVRSGVALGTANNIDHFSDILGLMILQNGGNPGQPDNPTVTSALKFYTLFSTQDEIWDETLPNSTYAFATEKVVMIFAPSWRALEIKNLNPDLNFKLYPVPQLPGTNINWATYWVDGVSQKSENQPAAFEFLKYLSSKEALTKFHNQASQTRLFGEPYPRTDMASNLQANPYLSAIVSQAQAAQSWYMSSRTFDNGLNDKIIKYYQDAVNALNQPNKPPDEDIIEPLKSGVSQVLSQYGLSSE